MENLTEIVEEVQPKKRIYSPKQRKMIGMLAQMSGGTYQDDGFDDVDINIILEECMRNVDQHSSFVFSEIVSYKNKG
jgi:hypothetical protein